MSVEQPRSCGQPYCYPEDTGCAKGLIPHQECTHFIHTEVKQPVTPGVLIEGEGVPWTGSALGVDDIAWLASRQRPLLYAPVGAHNVGKTTYLASLYIGLCRGMIPAKHEFIGSFTLGGWEKLATYMRHAPDGIGPGFPPHTPRTENRLPGWLHVGLRTIRGQVRDVLLADTPGEWFSRWAIQPEEEGADGARWVAHHSDGFIFFVDSAGLVGPDRRIVAEKTELLAERLAGVLANRPVAIVWAKSDLDIRPQIRNDVEVALKRAFPASETFRTSILSTPDNEEPTRPFWNPLEWLLLQDPNITPLRVADTVDPTNSFLAFRG